MSIRQKQFTILWALVLLCGSSGIASTRPIHSTHSKQDISAIGEVQSPPTSSLDRQALSFEENRGQTDKRVRFLCRGGSTVFFSASEVTLGGDGGTLRLGFRGANPAPHVVGVDPVDRTSNYLVGADPSRWKKGIAHFAAVRYEHLYPGVDAIFYGSHGQLEFDFVLAAGADPDAIRLNIDGASTITLDASGDLHIRLGAETVVERAPRVFQSVEGVRRDIPARYLLDGNVVRFAVGAHDPSIPLVIDPILAYSTYLGGSAGDDGADVATDSFGSVFVTGFTQSADFPAVGTRNNSPAGGADVYVARFNPDGRGGSYSTYIGGSGGERGLAIALGTRGEAFVTGFTTSTDFPVVNAFQRTLAGGSDAFVFKLSEMGDDLEYSTYLGGSDDENSTPQFELSADIAVETTGSAVVIGHTQSKNFPVSRTALQFRFGGGTFDAFIVRFGPQGLVPVFATYLGGIGDDFGKGIALDQFGDVYFAGRTSSVDLPVSSNAVQPQFSGTGGGDAFVGKLNAIGTSILYATYLGGRGDGASFSWASGITVDPAGNAYIVGATNAADFPVAGNFLVAPQGKTDAFVAKLDRDATNLLFSTFVGGSENDRATGVTLDSGRNLYVVGWTESTNFPQKSPVQSGLLGPRDAFVTKLSADGRRVIYSTYVGGTGADIGQGIAALRNGKVYITGVTSSTDFLSQNAFQPQAGGQGDAFLTKIIDVFVLDWDAPDPNATNPTPPPRFLRSRRALDDSEEAKVAYADQTVQRVSGAARAFAPSGRAEEVEGYNIYISPTPNATPAESTLLTSVPPTQTTTGAAAPGGSFFVVTAVYPSGESSTSNEASGGAGEATIATIKVKSAKIKVTGEGFTDAVQVFIDGIPFVSAAKVKSENTTVVQKGTLLTGQSIGEYIDSRGGLVVISFRNSDGAVANYRYEGQ